jgi:hypothetical protein
MPLISIPSSILKTAQSPHRDQSQTITKPGAPTLTIDSSVKSKGFYLLQKSKLRTLHNLLIRKADSTNGQPRKQKSQAFQRLKEALCACLPHAPINAYKQALGATLYQDNAEFRLEMITCTSQKLTPA